MTAKKTDKNNFNKLDDFTGILHSVYQTTHNGMLIADHDATILAVNPAFTKITGYTEDEVIGRRPNILNSGRQDKAFYAAMWKQLLGTGQWEGEIWNRRKNGEIYPEWLSISAVQEPDGPVKYYVATFTDISTIKNQHNDLIQLAFYDPLTQLPNRVLFHDRLNVLIKQAQREGKSFALLFIDVDNFKTINDHYGHLAGDSLLQETANRLSACVRASDTVARLAGDEFTIILNNAGDCSGITTVLKNILRTTGTIYRIDNHDISCSLSIGVAIYPESGTDAATLIKHADSAMYQAKQAGKNSFHFHALPTPFQNYQKKTGPSRLSNLR